MEKNSFKVKTITNVEKINVGATVRLIDGSSLSCINALMDFYIVESYEDMTGSKLELQHIDAEVIEVGVSDYVCEGVNGHAYLQDIVIKIGLRKFRTSSGLVKIVEEQTFSVGDMFECPMREKYILAQVDKKGCCLISLEDGNRWSAPIEVKYTRKITLKEIDKMSGACGSFKKIQK